MTCQLLLMVQLLLNLVKRATISSLGFLPMITQLLPTLRQRACLGPCRVLNSTCCLHTSNYLQAEPVDGPRSRGEAADPTHSQGREACPADQPCQAGSAATPPQAPQQHWLDKHFPGAREWLERKNREWWIKALVDARCK